MFGNVLIHEKRVGQYFSFFAEGDSESLRKIISNDCMFLDWNVNVHGKEVVVHSHEDIWNQLPDPSITLISADFIGAKAYCATTVDSSLISEPINMLFVMTFDEEDNTIVHLEIFRR